MKIKLNPTFDQISAVVKLTYWVYDLEPTINVVEIQKRIEAYAIADKFMAKRKSIIKNGDAFKKKHFKMTLNHNEATSLNEIISSKLYQVNDIYYRVILDKLKNELHQQLL